MRVLMLTGARDAPSLARELQAFRFITNQEPDAIVGHHDLEFAIASDPRSTADEARSYFDRVPVKCLCEVWDEEADALNCKAEAEGEAI